MLVESIDVNFGPNPYVIAKGNYVAGPFSSERVNRLTMCAPHVVILKIGCSLPSLAGSH